MNAPPPWLVRPLTVVADALLKLRRRMIPRHFGIVELGTMSWVSASVAAFCELDLPRALANEPRTAEELAASGYGNGQRIFRLLRSMAAYDVVKHVGEGRFALGHLGKALVGEESAAPMLRYANASWHLQAYAHLGEGIRRDRPAFDLVQNTSLFSYFSEHADAGEAFDAAMQSLTPLYAHAFARACDFSGADHVVDVGGGTGSLLRCVLVRFPHLRGTVFERPSVAARVQATPRLAAAAGSMFADALPTADAYILSHVLHDWDDASCVRILENVRAVMPAHARVLIYEIVAPPPSNWWSQDRITDLEMLAMLPGKERTLQEFAALAKRARLRLSSIRATSAPESVIEYVPDENPSR